jgi:hypothetical protein
MNSFNGKYITGFAGFCLVLCALLFPILGFSPYTFMIPIAQFGQYFMHGHDLYFTVEFFAWANIRGAVASLSIGAIIYTLIVRGCLMTKDAAGRSIYINVWPKRIDIETYVYKPLILGFLPFVGALFARTIGSLVGVVSAIGFRAVMFVKRWWIANTGHGVAARDLAEARQNLDEMQGKGVLSRAQMAVGAYQRVDQQLVYANAAESAQQGQEHSASILHPGEDLALARRKLDELQGQDSVAVLQKAIGAYQNLNYQQLYTQATESVSKSAESYSNMLKRQGFFRVLGSIWGDLVVGDFAEHTAAGERLGITRTILNSLAYSMVLSLVGLILVLVFVLPS